MNRKKRASIPNNRMMLAIYAYVDDVCRAIEQMKAEQIAVHTVYSPAHSHEVSEALGLKPSPVRRFVLLGGISGVIFGTALAIYTGVQWNLIVSGKSPIPTVSNVVISFEFCILFAILSGLAGLLISARLPRFRTPAHYDPRFTVDRYGLLLACPPERSDAVRQLLAKTGAEEIRDV